MNGIEAYATHFRILSVITMVEPKVSIEWSY